MDDGFTAASLRTIVLIDAASRARMQADPKLYERFVDAEVDVLERAYRQGTPPRVVALAAHARRSALEGVAGWPSAAHARLTGQLGQMLVAGGGSASVMAEAEGYLVDATAELCSLADWTRARLTLLAELTLNHAVTLKARGMHADAVHVLRSTILDRNLRAYWSRGDTLPLVRQDVIMAGGVQPHRWLAEQRDAMRSAGALETYRTMKRLLEFVMNSGRFHASEFLMRASVEAFRPLASSSAPLAKISLVKNVGQFESLARRDERALRYLELAKRAAIEQTLSGQIRQIDTMIELIRAGERPFLTTYMAA